MSGYIEYANQLTLDQWREEIWGNDLLGGPIFKAFEREVNSFRHRDPMRSLLERLYIESEGANADPYCRWITHGVSVSDACYFPTTIFFYFYTERYAGHLAAETLPPLEHDDVREELEDGGDRETYLLRVEAVLLINNDGEISSEIVEICAETDDCMFELYTENHKGCLLDVNNI